MEKKEEKKKLVDKANKSELEKLIKKVKSDII